MHNEAMLAVQAHHSSAAQGLRSAAHSMPHAARRMPHAACRTLHAARRTGFYVGRMPTWCSTCGAGSIARIFPALIVQLPELFVANIFHRKVVQALLLQWDTDH